MTRFARREIIRTVIVDDDVFSRIALVGLLGQAGLAVAAAVTTSHAADAVEREAPDVVIVGLDQLDRLDVEVVRDITAAAPASRAIVLVNSGQGDGVAAAMRAGAIGRVLRDGPVEDIIIGIRSAASGRAAIPPDVAAVLLAHARSVDAPLSAREQRVLELIADGCTERDIAAELALELRAVRVLARGSLRKLQLRGDLQRVRQRRDTPP